MQFPFFGKNTKEQKQAEVKSILSSSNFVTLFGQNSVYGYLGVPLQQILMNYRSIAPVYSAVSRIAASVASLPIELVETKTNTPIRNHPAYKLLRHPNNVYQPIMRDFIRDWVSWKILSGNVYMASTGLVKRPPLELYLFDPSEISVITDDSGFPTTLTRTLAGGSTSLSINKMTMEYVFSEALGQYINDEGTQLIYRASNFNVGQNGSLTADSELSSLYFEINHYLLSSQHNNSLLSNGARPSGALMVKESQDGSYTLDETTFQRLKMQFNENYAGAGNAGRPLIIEGGLEWQPLQMSPVDLDFAKLRTESENAIYKALGVPIELINAGGATAGNVENIRAEFYFSRVLPIAGEICDHLNNILLPRYGKDESSKYHFAVMLDEVPAIMKYRIERRKSIENSTTLTVDEKRAIFYHAPIKYGNKIVDPNGRPIAGEDATTIVEATTSNQPEQPQQTEETTEA